MSTLLEKVRKGIAIKSFFNYDGELIPVRAITSAEADDARYNTMGLLDYKLAKLMMRLRLGEITGEKIDYSEIHPDLLREYLRYLKETDYWIVYHGMKDFQPDDFTVDDVYKMRLVHEMAEYIIMLSSAPADIIIDEISTEQGQELAKIVYEFKVPLTNEAWKMTPLQHQFMRWASPDAPKKVAENIDELGNILPRIGDAMNRVTKRT